MFLARKSISFDDATREDLDFLSKLAEESERYHDLADFMRRLVILNSNLTVEERNKFGIANKNVRDEMRTARRTLISLEEKDSEHISIIRDYRQKIDHEILKTSNETISFIEKHFSNQSDSESKVFFIKMRADQFRFIAEVASGKMQQDAMTNANNAYKEGQELAKKLLSTTNVIRLGLALNYTVLLYEVLKDKSTAISVAKQTFDEAISQLESIGDKDYKDATLIMQLLRDNITLWSEDQNDGEEKKQEENKEEPKETHSKPNVHSTDHSKLSREELIYLAKVAEQVERYEDMMDYMRKASLMGKDFSAEERLLFSVAYKNVVGQRRAAYRLLGNHSESNDRHLVLLGEYKERVTSELSNIAESLLTLLDQHVLKKAQTMEGKVFFLKMKADSYRWMSEITADEANKRNSELAGFAYQEAWSLAIKEMKPTSPIRLGLALNYTVYYYEIMQETKKACELAKKAFDEAIETLDELGDDEYKDTTTILQLLRDNLTLWTSDAEGNQEY